MIEERYELALDRIRLMKTEDTVGEPYRDYFKKLAEFVLMLDELRTELLDGRYQKLELDELRKWNRRLYQDVLPGQYEKSYANPDYACKMLGKESGQILGMLYAELRGAVVYVFEGKTEYLAILYSIAWPRRSGGRACSSRRHGCTHRQERLRLRPFSVG